MILITGATGHLGKATLDALLKQTSPANVAALVRTTAKAQAIAAGVTIRQGDYNDYASLVAAFKGVDKLYFISGSDVAVRMQQHENVVNAAKEAGVKHVVYTSFQRKNETDASPIAVVAKSHIHTEKMLKASGLPYTIMKHTIYTDMIPMFAGEKVLETGTLFLPAGDGRVAFATRADMAEAAAHVLTTEGHENKIYEISGNATYSYTDIAAIISELSGKKVTYVSPTPEDFRTALANAGVPAEYIGIFAAFSEGFKQGEFDRPDPTLEKMLGRKPVSVKEFLNGVYGA